MKFSIEKYFKHKTCFKHLLFVAASEKGIIALFFLNLLRIFTQYIMNFYGCRTEPIIVNRSLKINCSLNFVGIT